MISPERMQALILSVGVHRKARPLTPVEVGEALSDLLSTRSIVEASELLRCEPTTLRKFQKLAELPEKIRHSIDWGSSKTTLSFSAAAELSRLQRSDQEIVADAALEHGMSKDEVRQVVQIRKRSEASAADCVNQVLRLRPEIVQIYVYFGAIGDSNLRETLGDLQQGARDQVFGRALNANFADMQGISGRLTKIGFSIVSARALTAEELDGVDARIARSLRRMLSERT